MNASTFDFLSSSSIGFVNIISSLLVVKSLGCVIITRFDIVLASVSIQLLSDFLRLTVRITLVTSSES